MEICLNFPLLSARFLCCHPLPNQHQRWRPRASAGWGFRCGGRGRLRGRLRGRRGRRRWGGGRFAHGGIEGIFAQPFLQHLQDGGFLGSTFFLEWWNVDDDWWKMKVGSFFLLSMGGIWWNITCHYMAPNQRQ